MTTSDPESDSRGPRYRWQGLSSATRDILATKGEAGRFEFKRDADAVNMRVLVAAANASVVEDVGPVTLLVGVDEQTDPETGAVSGVVVGLPDLERAKQVIRSRASETRPVPIGLTVYEENLAAKPILRVVVRATRTPHYDTTGARVTRDGASHRALTDEELLDLYLRREVESFRERFQAVAADLAHSLDTVDDRVEALGRGLEDAKSAIDTVYLEAREAAGYADESHSTVWDVLGVVQTIETEVAERYGPFRTQSKRRGGRFADCASSA